MIGDVHQIIVHRLNPLDSWFLVFIFPLKHIAVLYKYVLIAQLLYRYRRCFSEVKYVERERGPLAVYYPKFHNNVFLFVGLKTLGTTLNFLDWFDH